MDMLKYLVIAAFAVSTAAQAAPVANNKKSVDEALKREQRIKDLGKAPASVYNICRGC
jgi:anaerobic selenocysteine-containing dehydrogenase